MWKRRIAFWTVAAMLSLVTDQSWGQGHAVVTVLPKVEGRVPSSVTQQDLAVKIDGKNARVTKWEPFQAPNNQIELVLLIDGAARSSLGRQMGDIEQFVKSLPPNVKAGIAYMENGRAVFGAPLTTDRAQTLGTLHIPGGVPGIEASPYFCLSDLAKNWPGQNPQARREVVMVTDGVDNYERRYDPEDPYVDAAINDAARARLVVYSIYWMNQGRADRTEYATNDGQNLLEQVAQATGGKSFWQGMGNPVSFQSYFEELSRRFRNQYELGFTSVATDKAGVEEMKLKLHAPGTEIDAPQKVFVVPDEAARK
jgi:hypothetical protein